MILNPRWAIFLSGRGSTAQAALDCLSEVDVKWVVSSKADAFGLARARRMGVATSVLPKKIDWQGLHQELLKRRITHIFLLGFMRMIPSDFVSQWQKRIFNVHPSMLPAFPGAHSMDESFSSGKPMGVTIHEVTAEMDAGPRLLQQQVLPQQGRKPQDLPRAQMQMAACEQRLIRLSIQKIRGLQWN